MDGLRNSVLRVIPDPRDLEPVRSLTSQDTFRRLGLSLLRYIHKIDGLRNGDEDSVCDSAAKIVHREEFQIWFEGMRGPQSIFGRAIVRVHFDQDSFGTVDA